MKSSGERIPKADSIVAAYIKKSVPEIESLNIESDGNINFSLMVNFNNNEAIILPDSEGELMKLLEVLRVHNDVQLEIIGHTDDVGDANDNQILSENRAEAVKRFLEKNKIEENRLVSSGKGESEPISSNEDEIGRFMNRRVEFKLSY